MWGRATLAMVMSRMTMIIAAITEMVTSPRCLVSTAGRLRVCGALAIEVAPVRGLLGRGGGAGAALGVDRHGGAEPGAQRNAVGGASKRMRTGTRWTTLTQLPVAFWAGSSENSEPVPAPMLSTVPSSFLPG